MAEIQRETLPEFYENITDIPWVSSDQLDWTNVQWYNTVIWDIETAQSQIAQNETDISLRVQKNDVINQINVSTEWILIDADNIQISWSTTFSSWYDPSEKLWDWDAANDINTNTTTINWWKITTWTIDADKMNVSQLSAISANIWNITSGTITWATMQTDTSWRRVVLANDIIRFYNSSSDAWYFDWNTVAATWWPAIVASWALWCSGLFAANWNIYWPKFYPWQTTYYMANSSNRPVWYNWSGTYSILHVTSTSSSIWTVDKKLKVNVAWTDYWLHAETA